MKKKLPEVLTTKQLAEYWQTSLTTIFKMIKDGKLRGRKVGRGYRFLRVDVDNYLRGELDPPQEK